MKKYLWLIISVSLLVFCLTGCNNNNSKETSDQKIEDIICENTYSADILGYNLEGKLEKDGTGNITVDGKTYDFKYTLTDPTADSAKITINDTGISEIDGKSADVKLEGDDLVVTYGGLSYTVKADK